MSSIGTGYDLSASQFSPDGRVFQVEYAGKAVENSSTVIGLSSKAGVVFAVEKLIQSKLYMPGSNKRIFYIDNHIGMAVAGLISDARAIVEVARKEAKSYHTQNGVPIPIKNLNRRLALYMHAYSLYSSIRPFGCSVAICSFDQDHGGEMYFIEPSGNTNLYNGWAIGKAAQSAHSQIENLGSLKEKSLVELVNSAATIIYQVHDELKDKNFELEMSWIGDDGVHRRVDEAILKRAEEQAKTKLTAESEEEESEKEGDDK